MYSRTMIEPPHSSSAIFSLPGPLSFGILRIHGSSTGECQGKQAARRGARRRTDHGTDHGWAEEQGLSRSIILCLVGLKALQSAPLLSHKKCVHVRNVHFCVPTLVRKKPSQMPPPTVQPGWG